jgi:hypothetical protein
MNKALCWILLLLCTAVGWAGFWPLYLGVATARSGSGFTEYGPLLALAVLLFGAATSFAAWLICRTSN